MGHDNCHGSCIYHIQGVLKGRLNTSEVPSHLALPCSWVSKRLAQVRFSITGQQLVPTTGSLFLLLLRVSSDCDVSHVWGLLSPVSRQFNDASCGYYDDAAWNGEAGGVLKNRHWWDAAESWHTGSCKELNMCGTARQWETHWNTMLPVKEKSHKQCLI